ncbi:MAG: response regulator [Planctomycetota bacterium]|nr:MAG: response regulator [Planctomycetota bacterium]
MGRGDSYPSQRNRVVEADLADFVLRRSADVRLLVHRARMLASLVSLPRRRRRELEQAVSDVCKAILQRGATAQVHYRLSQQDGQRYVEVTLAMEEPAADRSPADPATEVLDQPSSDTYDDLHESLQQWGEGLDLFEIQEEDSNAKCEIRLGQALLPAFESPTESEADRWGQILDTDSLEEALALSIRHCRAVDLRLEMTHSRQSLEKEFGAATAREHLAMLSLVASKSRNLICFMDAQGRITWVNEAFCQSTGYAPLEANGRTYADLLFGPDTDQRMVRDYLSALRNGHDFQADLKIYRRDGRPLWVECNLIPVRNEDGQITRWMSVDVDITQRRETEENLRAAKEHAEAIAKLKSEFLANMSHEIRTPMNAIIGMTELALATDLTPEQRDYLGTVRNSAETLLQLLNDILDLSKIEAGKLTIDEVPFNFVEAIRDTLKAMAVKAHEKGLELAAHVPMDIPQYVIGDPIRFKQILFNLVGNAIKFTEKGEVVVDVEAMWRTDDEMALHFSVRDTGIGIPKDKLNQIFEPFSQVDSAATRNYGGTGLGLAITSQLIKMMQGKIWVESTVGKGSTFHFTLQFKIAKNPPPVLSQDADVSALNGKRVLIVDDNATNRRILDELLRHWGLTTFLADGAESALQQVAIAQQEGRPFDLVIVDAMMPKVSGFELARALRQQAAESVGTILMLSSADRPGSMQQCREAGIDHFLVKPVSASNLLNMIMNCLVGEYPHVPDADKGDGAGPQRTSSAAQRDAGEESSRPASVRPLKILVVDDHESNRHLATTILKKRGHTCVEATNGEEAVKAARREKFDLILMDVQMPVMDGFFATRAIRELERGEGRHTPIVAMTAHAMRGDREKCLAQGMDAYIAKPLRPSELVALVESLAGVDEKAAEGKAAPSADSTVPASVDSQASYAGTGNPGDSGTTSEAGGVAIDLNSALESLDGDRDLLAQQIEFFLNDAPRLLDDLDRGLQSGDAALIEIAAHRLKGLVSRYGNPDATRLAREIEQSASEGETQYLGTQVRELRRIVEAMLVQLRELSGA